MFRNEITEMQESRPQRAGCKTVKKRMEVGKTDCLCLSLLPDAHYLLIPSLNLKPRIQFLLKKKNTSVC